MAARNCHLASNLMLDRYGSCTDLDQTLTVNSYMKGGREKGYPAFLKRKMLKRKPYIKNKTAPHTRTVTCCVLASVMRGTFTARVMVQKESKPSG